MHSSNQIKSPQKIKNISLLSKDAINFLSNQFVKNGDSKTIDIEFTFQVIYAIQKLTNWYCCSLMDQNSKYGGFCVKYNKRYGTPKIGDIIKTKKIKIVKLPNRDTYIYFCDNVKRIEESKKMIINPQQIQSLVQVHSTSKKKMYLKYKIFQNYHEEDNNIININNDNNIKLNSPNQKNIINLEENVNKNINNSSKKPILISELTSFDNNPLFILKCLAKSEIKPFASKYNIVGIDYVQNYLFCDINGDKIQAVSYTFDVTEKIDKLLKINSIYKISRANRRMNFKKEFSYANGNIQLSFTFFTKFEELTDEEKKLYQFKDKTELTKIKDLKNGENKIYNLIAIVLEDKGIIEKRKTTNEIVKYRRLIIGDDSLYKVSLKLWENFIEPKKLYLKGDIIHLKDFKYRQWIYYHELNSSFASKILFDKGTKQGKDLKKFFYNHQKIEEYKDLNFEELDSKNDIQIKFINDFLNEFGEDKKIYSFQLIKINGTVETIEHGDGNVFSGCKFCCKKFEDICPNCNSYNKKLYFDFRVKIADCSNHLWVHFFGEIAENFMGISPEEYQILIKNNKKYRLDEISKKILYHEYTFFGKYVTPNSDELKTGGFSVINFKKVDNDYFRKLISQINNNS